jgi:hypothetical protein
MKDCPSTTLLTGKSAISDNAVGDYLFFVAACKYEPDSRCSSVNKLMNHSAVLLRLPIDCRTRGRKHMGQKMELGYMDLCHKPI